MRLGSLAVGMPLQWLPNGCAFFSFVALQTLSLTGLHIAHTSIPKTAAARGLASSSTETAGFCAVRQDGIAKAMTVGGRGGNFTSMPMHMQHSMVAEA